MTDAPRQETLPPEDTDLAADPDMMRVERLGRLMDSQFRIPVIGYRIGLDGLLGLVPGIGDAVTLLPAGYIIYEAHRMGAPRHVLARMVVNSGMDAAIGTVPLIGDLFDIAFKSNRRNVDLLRRHVADRARAAKAPPYAAKASRKT